MWGEYELLHFYPRNWQTGFFRSGHVLVNYITVWQYWLWFTFIFLINVYFVIIFRSFSFRRADIRGRRAVGDKRRGAWPELFSCFFPLLWCFNILNNSLNILKTVEVNGSYAALTMQIAGFQWGWRYCYGELNYVRLLLAPVKVGYDSTIRYGKTYETANTHYYDIPEAKFCRAWLHYFGVITTADDERIKTEVFRPGLTLVAQGSSSTQIATRRYIDGTTEYLYDPLRLLRATGMMVLPTRSVVRLLATAEDVTHSWAVPGLGIKLDCVPGRLFVSFVNINREGVYYGQCSELCGWNHYNMPIVLYALPIEHFIIWWELELHETFQKTIADTSTHYNLLNVKYK